MAATLPKLARAALAGGVVGAGAAVPLESFLSAAPASASTRVAPIGIGASGTGVKCIQRGLDLLDIPVTADGQFGTQTRQGVLLLQKKYQFDRRDGVVGPEEGTFLYATLSDHGLSNCYGAIPTLV